MLEIIILTILIVIAFVAAGWYSHNRNQQQARAFERELDPQASPKSAEFRQRFDAVFDKELQEYDADASSPRITIDDDSADFSDAAQIRLNIDDDGELPADTAQPATAAEPDDAVVREWDMVVALTVMAPADTVFNGKAVKNILENLDLHFGDMQIYHRYSSGSRRQSLFSVANILDPGTLLPDELPGMHTPGLLLFARLPGPLNGMAMFDLLLDTAEQMSAQLGGILCDDQRQPLSEAAVESLRSRIFNFNMALQNEQKSVSDDYLN